MAAERSEESNLKLDPIADLQLQALEQRRQIHNTVSDLRNKVLDTRENLRLAKQARNHLLPASLMAALIAFASGYGLAGLFTRR